MAPKARARTASAASAQRFRVLTKWATARATTRASDIPKSGTNRRLFIAIARVRAVRAIPERAARRSRRSPPVARRAATAAKSRAIPSWMNGGGGSAGVNKGCHSRSRAR